MGNQHGKGGEKSPFTQEELKVLEASYRACGGHSDKMSMEKLTAAWSSVIDSQLVKSITNFLFHPAQKRVATINFKRFTDPYYAVEIGTIDDKVNFLAASLNKSDNNVCSIKDLESYITAVFKSFIQMQAELSTPAYNSWKQHGYQSAERTIIAFAKSLTRSMQREEDHSINLFELERWLQSTPIFLLIWRETFQFLYGKNGGKVHKIGMDLENTNILPVMEGLALGTNYLPILDIPHVIFVNSNLPNDKRNKWRFLFSSKIMGESFSTMLGKILNRGPTLLIIEDEDRHVFGGYASDSWALKPQFFGDDTTMLFTLSPAMRCFNATTYNDHYQYLNLNQQTMPNGLGMGGQFNYWGLWVDCEYGVGQSSETCTTYRDYMQLSKRKEFRIRNMEVWAIGDLPKKDDESDEEEGTNKRSILDKNLEDRVMLELSGKTMHSDGLREPELDL